MKKAFGEKDNDEDGLWMISSNRAGLAALRRAQEGAPLREATTEVLALTQSK